MDAVSLDAKEPWTFLDGIRPRNSVTGAREFHLIPLQVENFVGASLYRTYILQSGGQVPSKYRRYEEMVQRIGKSLAENSPRSGLNFEFTVVNDWSLNAWCLPGGKIALNIGLLNALENEHRDFGERRPSFEEKVAAVLSHEITHATARHYGRTMEFKLMAAALVKAADYGISYLIRRYYDQKIDTLKDKKDPGIKTLEAQKNSTLTAIRQTFSQYASYLVTGLGYCDSRKYELEADKFGMILMHKTGKSSQNPHLTPRSAQSAIWLQKFFQQQKPHSPGGAFSWINNLLSTHPTSEERIKANQKTWAELTT